MRRSSCPRRWGPAVVHSIYDELIAAGIPVLAPPKVYEWNACCFYFADPDSNTWEIYAWNSEGPYGAGVPPKNKNLPGRTQP